jgi:YebC/PmpR family DNA-binding regulatory protein
VLVACMTDNRNRTVSEVRHAFARHGGNLGAEGSVGYLFNAVGQLGYPPGTDEEKLVEAALEAGAEDVVGDELGGFEVLTDPQDFLRVKSALDAAGLAPERAEVTLRSSVHTALDPDDGAKLMQLMDSLDELDDVQNVYTNAEVPAGALAQAGWHG